MPYLKPRLQPRRKLLRNGALVAERGGGDCCCQATRFVGEREREGRKERETDKGKAAGPREVRRQEEVAGRLVSVNDRWKNVLRTKLSSSAP